jgi:hypothetical protein
MNNSYEPIPIRPLTMRGVFGITWAITKRRFFSAVMYTLIWLLISTAVLVLFAAPAVIGFSSGETSTAAGFGALSILLVLLWAAAQWLVVNPILYGGIYTEMSMRIYGQCSNAGKLFSRTGFSLKRFFTLNLCQSVGSWIAGIAVSIVGGTLSSIITAGSMMSAVIKVSGRGLMGGSVAINSLEDLITLGSSFIVPVVLSILINALASICAVVPLAYTYPVAINENKKNFSALGRGVSLGFKRYGRTLLATLIASVVFGAISAVVCALFGVGLGFSLAYESLAGVIIFFVLIFAAAYFIAAVKLCYLAALHTVLYHDAHTREAQPAAGQSMPNPQQPQQSGAQGYATEQEQPYQPETENSASEPAQSEPENYEEEPEFVEKNDDNDF